MRGKGNGGWFCASIPELDAVDTGSFKTLRYVVQGKPFV